MRELLGVLVDARRKLGQLAEFSQTEFLADFRNTESAKYLLILATESAIGICNHFAARIGGRAPQNYADCFSVLAEIGVVNAELAQRLKRMARFRNLLVHLYWQVENERIHTIIRQDLVDLDAYQSEISAWLNAHEASQSRDSDN
jgi:uncharacterized protein YutE (UPF0331/DUF86 family)